MHQSPLTVDCKRLKQQYIYIYLHTFEKAGVFLQGKITTVYNQTGGKENCKKIKTTANGVAVWGQQKLVAK